MADLFVIAYEDEFKAEEVRLRLFWFLCGNEVYTDRISAK